jgi:N-acetylmuramoyl-L-alanine amidase
MEIFKKGSRGEGVKEVQRLLSLWQGTLVCDGIFGEITEEVVRAFQSAHGLSADGIVGAATLQALREHEKTVTADNLNLKKSKRVITEIIVHCSATPEGRPVTTSEITAWHKQRGFATIGYHYVIYLDGTIHEGRNIDAVGAHCTNHNVNSVGVCYVGGCANDGKLTPKDTRTPEQKVALQQLLKNLCRTYPKAKIFGHRDFANKACPSFNARKEYSNI